jgi:LmbE family N-acetylglucosaminyl deacetylase
MRKAFEEGHRVVLVVATRGELGEVPEGLLVEGEPLWRRRVAETQAAAGILGVARVEFLGYHDSGMMGEETNNADGSFWTASVEEAAGRLAAILREENADVLTVYDDNGAYGHPDHIQVHRVGMRAAELAGTPRVYQSTINRDQVRRGRAEFAGNGGDGSLPDVEELGKPESEITAAVDVTAYLEYKRHAMRAHASQISEQSFFLALPDEPFRHIFGTEWFIRAGQGPGVTETDLLGAG